MFLQLRSGLAGKQVLFLAISSKRGAFIAVELPAGAENDSPGADIP